MLTGAFLPVILEQLARENGYFFSDSTKKCVDHGDAGSLRMRAEGQNQTDQCIIRFLGKTMSTSSFAMYTFSAAVMVQAVTLVCFSSFADHGMSLHKHLGHCL
jgi:UMF1 family MFS transporter